MPAINQKERFFGTTSTLDLTLPVGARILNAQEGQFS